MSDDGQPGDKSSLVLVMSVISAMTAAGGGGYVYRGADDVPTVQAQDTAKIFALLDRKLPAIELKLKSIQEDLDAIDKKLVSLRDRVGDVCGPRQR